MKDKILTILLIFALSATFVFNILVRTGDQQYSNLAQSFLQGKFYFLDGSRSWGDSVFYKGHYFWPLGPFPSILLTPFVYIFNLKNIFFYQGYLQFFLTLGVFYFCRKIAKHFGFSEKDSLFLSFAFCFATVYQQIALVSWSWYFVQAVTTLLIFWAISEYLTKRRFWLIGTIFALICMSRFTAGLGILFFLLNILSEVKKSFYEKAKNLSQLLAPVVLAGILLLLYNYFRFENIWDNGYVETNNSTLTSVQRFELENYGLFSLKNIPTNFYYYFIKTVDPTTLDVQSSHGNTYVLKFPFVRAGFPGVGFFITSPIFLYIFKADFRKKINKFALYTIVLILILLLTYYWPGYRQTGPRYMLDLLPFAYLILLSCFKGKKLSNFIVALIIFSSFFNFYLFAFS